jgi:protein-S-isoprenylcysteine O-methyltransferase Ste14
MEKDKPGVIAFPPLIWLVTVVASLLVHFFVGGVPISILPRTVSIAIGIVSLMTGPLLAIPAAMAMKAAGTNVHPSKPATTVVRGGPYRFTRNPMYLALCLLQISLGFFLNDWITLFFVIPLALILHFGVILREERYLEAKFGEEYLALKRRVRRWI